MSDAAPRIRHPRDWDHGDWSLFPQPERQIRKRGAVVRFVDHVAAWPMARLGPGRRRLDRFARQVIAEGAPLQGLDDDALAERIAALRQAGAGARTVTAFALVREVTGRLLGMRHYPVQIMAARVLLKGGVAELATGEGKTITGLLAAITSALRGLPAHVITVNPYLAERDAAQLRPVIEAFGLRVGVILQDMAPADKRRAYGADVVFVTNKDLGFDYLRDMLELGAGRSRARGLIARLAGPVRPAAAMRGLPFALLDEADLVLADEARIPLVISGPRGAPEDPEDFIRALQVARALTLRADFTLRPDQRAVELTDAGRKRVAAMAADWPGIWRARRGREERVTQALAALHIYMRGQHYVVVDDEVQIVDENTGRISPGRAWERGLHQTIETKEGLPPSGRADTAARITYQRLFRRYLRLSGMTGTARGLETELWRVYGMKLHRIPTHRPRQRRDKPPVLYADSGARWDAVARRAMAVAQSGRPVLIGTRSVESSQHLADLLHARGAAPRVLNALQDAEEADIVAGAGAPGCITIATNMAGRGTDIKLAPGVEAAGGLHVIVAEPNDSARSDRQLVGRAGRQGDPGSSEAMAAPQDDLLRLYLPGPARMLAAFMRRFGTRHLPGGAMVRLAQLRAERRGSVLRAATLKSDEDLSGMLGFAGRGE